MNELAYRRKYELLFVLKVTVTYLTNRNKAILLSLLGDHAGAWLLAVPYHSIGLSFNSTEFRVLLDICWAYLYIIYLVHVQQLYYIVKALLDIYVDHIWSIV